MGEREKRKKKVSLVSSTGKEQLYRGKRATKDETNNRRPDWRKDETEESKGESKQKEVEKKDVQGEKDSKLLLGISRQQKREVTWAFIGREREKG